MCQHGRQTVIAQPETLSLKLSFVPLGVKLHTILGYCLFFVFYDLFLHELGLNKFDILLWK